MLSTKRAYLIIPKLIEQPTWGGTYILNQKNWLHHDYLQDKTIGQSYELFGQSKLLLTLSDSTDTRFIGELGLADKDDVTNTLPYAVEEYITLADLVQQYPNEILGKKTFDRFKKMPLLVKFTQAAGNSFQLHVKPTVSDKRWRPKAESWYYFEDGYLTYGIKPGISLDDYKAACKAIEEKMKTLSKAVQNNSKSLDEAKQEAKIYIQKVDPWSFINRHEVKKDSLIDLSLGGLHHSWEENKMKFPLGNVLYEVQQDVMDPISTIRSFDQGKMGKNGTIREIHIDDYFKYLDLDPAHNDLQTMMQKQKGNRLLTTSNYCLDRIAVTDKVQDTTNESFVHLFVQEGATVIITEGGSIHLTKGHSCFIPHAVNEYEIRTKKSPSVVLKTYIEN